jgi:hypothetical protein
MEEEGSEHMVNIMDLQPGDKVQLGGDVTAEVVANPRDGIWIQVRYLTHPENPVQVGTEELLFAEDIVDVMT